MPAQSQVPVTIVALAQRDAGPRATTFTRGFFTRQVPKSSSLQSHVLLTRFPSFSDDGCGAVLPAVAAGRFLGSVSRFLLPAYELTQT